MLKQLLLAALLFPFAALAAGECADNDAECQARVVAEREAALQAKYPKLISRQGGVLQIRSRSGVLRTFKDAASEDDEYVVYRMQQVLPTLEWVVIQVSHYEWSTVILVSLFSGQQIEFDGYEDPLLSPDSKHLLVFSNDMDAGYHSNFVALYRIDAYRIKEVLMLNGDHKMTPQGEVDPASDFWGPGNPQWLDGSTVAYTEDRYADGGQIGSHIQSTPVQLKLVDGNWKRIVVTNPAIAKE